MNIHQQRSSSDFVPESQPMIQPIQFAAQAMQRVNIWFADWRVLLCIALIWMSIISRAQGAQVITFEEMSPDGPGTGGVIPVLNFYSAKGVIFNAVALDYSKGIAIPNFAHSGTKAIETCYAAEFCSAPIEMSFTQPQARVKAWAGYSSALTQPITVVMRAFASNGTQVGQTNINLGNNTAPTSIQTPIEISVTTATITRVTIGVEIGGSVSFTNGLAIDDVEFDTAGPPPVCSATQDPVINVFQPAAGQTLQFNQFLIAFHVATEDPFAVTTVTDSGNGQTNSVNYPGFSGSFGPTWINGLLVPGVSTLTITVKDCHGTTQTSLVLNYVPIAADEHFNILGFETTQVVQNVPGSVPLVADKPTMVRVYLNTIGSTPKIDHVRGTLYAYRPLNNEHDTGPQLQGSVHSSNEISVDQNTDFRSRRVRPQFDGGLNFELPTEWITEGGVHFELSLDVDGSPQSPVGIPCGGCDNAFYNGRPTFVHFITMPTLRVRIVGLQYQIGNSPGLNAPRNLDFNLLQSWIRRVYPASQFEFSTTTVTANSTFPFDCDTANAQLSAIRATEVAAGRDTHTHYIGLVINNGGFMRGCASGIPDNPDTSVVASSPTGDTASGTGLRRPLNVSGDNDGSFGDWYGGHELTHTFGRKHPGFCNNNSSDDSSFPNPNGQISDNNLTYVGLDKGDFANAVPQTLIAPLAFDIMTYCNQPQWFSAYNYNAVLQRLRAENGFSVLMRAIRLNNAAAKISKPLANEVMTGNFLSVVAAVNLTRHTGVLRHIDHVSRATSLAVQPNQIAAIRISDKDGKVSSYSTWVREDTDIPPGADKTGLVQLVIPASNKIARIDLILNDKVVNTRYVSAHSPVIKGLKLVTVKTSCSCESNHALSWVGSDADKDKLTYLVQISDEGSTWDTLAIGLKESTLKLTAEQLHGAHHRIRVIANDGYNESNPVTLDLRRTKS